jgi:NAD(P)-dependent dehydrogenase (short-subunit alcohol dehydrogenase family)
VGLEPERLAEVAAACGPAATWHEADIADAAALQAAVAAAVAAHGHLDVVFANAGIAILGPVHRLDADDVARQFEVNLLGAFHTARATAEALIASRGYLLFNASIAAVAGIPSLGAYAASKSGVDALAAVLRTELGAHGVGVGVVYFGWVDTDLVRQDAHPDLKAVRGLPGPLGRAIPVGQAAAAVLRAVEGRRRTVVEPRWLAPTLPLRGFVRPVLEGPGRGSARALERRWERAAAARGVRDASRPRGPSRTGT